MAARANRVTATPYPFEPSGGASLACSTSTGSVALTGSGEQALVSNPGTAAVYVEFGASGVVATVASMAVLPNTQVLVTIPETSTNVKATHMAAITASGTPTIQVHTGWGV